MVPMLPLVLFTGKPIKVELHRGTFVLALEEGWIMFSVESHQVWFFSIVTGGGLLDVFRYRKAL